MKWVGGVALPAWLPILLASGLGLTAYLYPFWLPTLMASDVSGAHAADAPLLLVSLMLLSLLALAALTGQRSGPVGAGGGSKLVALLGVLVAVNSTLRLLPTVGGASPVFALIILVGYVYRASFGFLMGSLSLLLSALITGGVGPWLPYQMLGAGWLGLTAGWLPDLSRQRRTELTMLVAFGLLWGLLYGALLNLWFWPFVAADGGAESWLLWQPGLAPLAALTRYGRFYLVTSLVYDLLRSVATAALLLALAQPLLFVLRRFRRRFAWQPFEVTPTAMTPATEAAPGAD
jgi:energy-coupling factor transport system substrate-specific component